VKFEPPLRNPAYTYYKAKAYLLYIKVSSS